MLDYDLEAATYDQTRGGMERARAAANAVLELVPELVPGLVPERTAVLLDVACGTGIVSELLKAPGRTVIGVDASAGMLEVAKTRLELPVRGDATRLPIASHSADAVTFMWLLHLVSPEVVAGAVREAARVLRPGGVMVTTVNKNSAQFSTESDAGALLRAAQRELAPPATDDFERVNAVAAEAGLEYVGGSGYVGHNQGKSPRQWIRLVREQFTWSHDAAPERIAELCRELGALPGQDVRRPDPVYRVAGFRWQG
ncbi:class I SAM-dependent methyltransferase [Catenulispora yoronensis]|uniref:Class I SAM-dependent methyltransferase n=1 Tax=Catenulispora yoronensis TaxID=450799 RepID=A0ABN2VCR6_9ACTN